MPASRHLRDSPRHRWPSTHRTLEGSVAFLASVACAGLAILGSAPRQEHTARATHNCNVMTWTTDRLASCV